MKEFGNYILDSPGKGVRLLILVFILLIIGFIPAHCLGVPAAQESKAPNCSDPVRIFNEADTTPGNILLVPIELSSANLIASGSFSFLPRFQNGNRYWNVVKSGLSSAVIPWIVSSYQNCPNSFNNGIAFSSIDIDESHPVFSITRVIKFQSNGANKNAGTMAGNEFFSSKSNLFVSETKQPKCDYTKEDSGKCRKQPVKRLQCTQDRVNIISHFFLFYFSILGLCVIGIFYYIIRICLA
jgi:hypothetical protein